MIPQKEFDVHGKGQLSPYGEDVEIKTEDQKKWEGEFLFYDEQFVYLLMKNIQGTKSDVMTIPIETIIHIRVDVFINRQWKWYVLGFQVVPAITLGATYAAYSGETEEALAGTGILLIPAALSSLAFAASQPKQPDLKGKISYGELKELQKYARYPFTLNPDQKQKILENLENNYR